MKFSHFSPLSRKEMNDIYTLVKGYVQRTMTWTEDDWITYENLTDPKTDEERQIKAFLFEIKKYAEYGVHDLKDSRTLFKIKMAMTHAISNAGDLDRLILTEIWRTFLDYWILGSGDISMLASVREVLQDLINIIRIEFGDNHTFMKLELEVYYKAVVLRMAVLCSIDSNSLHANLRV